MDIAGVCLVIDLLEAVLVNHHTHIRLRWQQVSKYPLNSISANSMSNVSSDRVHGNTTPGPPSHELPVEILLDIIHSDIVDCIASSTHARRLKDLRQVCKLWMECIDGFPQLWTDIHWVNGIPADVTTRFLKNSKSHLLNVQCLDSLTGSSKAKKDVEAFLCSVTQHSRRWRSLILCAAMNGKTAEYVAGPAPNLEELVVDSHYDYQGFKLNQEGYARLTKLIVKHAGSPWITANLKGLTSLQVKGCWAADLRLNSLRALLEGSPNLEVLAIDELTRLSEGSEWKSLPNAQIPIHLPQLHTLFLGSTVCENLFDFLVSTIYPGDLISLTIISPTQSTLIGLDGTGWLKDPMMRLLTPVLRKATSLRLHNDPNNYIVRLHSDGHDNAAWRTPAFPAPRGMLVDLDTRDTSTTWESLATLLQTARVASPLSIHIGVDEPDTFPEDILRRLPTLRKITIQSRRVVEPVLRELCRTGSGNHKEVCCPVLDVIDLSKVGPIMTGNEVDLISLFLGSRSRRVEVILPQSG